MEHGQTISEFYCKKTGWHQEVKQADGTVSKVPLNANQVAFRAKVSPKRLGALLSNTRRAIINTATAKSVLEEMFQTGTSADDIINQRDLGQISDSGEIDKAVIQAIENNPKAVADYKAGKQQSLKFLMGQVMRATGGRANPKLVIELLEKKLEEG